MLGTDDRQRRALLTDHTSAVPVIKAVVQGL
jgi:hypothetical protein